MITNFASDIDEKARNTPPEAWASQVTTGFGENAWAMAKQTGRERLAVSGTLEELRHRPGVQIEESAATVGRRMLREGALTEEEIAFALVVPLESYDEEPYYDWEKVGGYIRTKHPDVKLDLRSERLVRRNEVIDELRRKETEITDRATFMGSVGQFTGAMPMYMVDPPNLVAMVASPWPLAAGASRTAQYAALGAEQLLVEGVTAFPVAAHRKSLGLEYGSKEIATDMAMSVAGGFVFKSARDASKGIAKQILDLKNSPKAQTPKGQKAIEQLKQAKGEADIAAAAGRPLDEVLDEADQMMTNIETSTSAKDLLDETDFPEVRPYDDDVKLAEDFEELMARREGKVPISAQEVDGRVEIEYSSGKELTDSFDIELEKTLAAGACFGI